MRLRLLGQAIWLTIFIIVAQSQLNRNTVKQTTNNRNINLNNNNPNLNPSTITATVAKQDPLQSTPITNPTYNSQIVYPLTIPPSTKTMTSSLKTAQIKMSLLKKQVCNNGLIFTDVAIRQHNTSFYLTAQQYYIYFSPSSMARPLYLQFLTAVQNRDCSWSFQTKDGLYISLNPNYNYLMLNEKIEEYQKFTLIIKKEYITIQSALTGTHYWTVVNGIARLASKQASRFVIQIWALPS